MAENLNNKKGILKRAFTVAALGVVGLGLTASLATSNAYASRNCDESYSNLRDQVACMARERNLKEKKQAKARAAAKKKEKGRENLYKGLVAGFIGVGGLAGAGKGVVSLEERQGRRRRKNKTSLAKDFALSVVPRTVAGAAAGAVLVAPLAFAGIGVAISCWAGLALLAGTIKEVLRSINNSSPK